MAIYTSQVADFIKYKNGTNGRGISGVVDYYYASTTETETIPEKGDSAWVTNITDTGFSATKKYLWNYEQIDYDNGDPSDTTTIAVISIYSKEIKEIVEWYKVNNDESTPTVLPVYNKEQKSWTSNGWTQKTENNKVPVPDQTNRYLWNYEFTFYTDGSFITSGPALTAAMGEEGNDAQDFNITASSYTLIKGTDGKYKNNIVLTAHKLNITGTPDWYVGDTKKDSGDTYTVTTPGTYTAKIGTKWEDSIVIGETVDGATGKDAIAITLSNPTMTFHTNTGGESETCQVIVYEGNKQLSATSTSGARFSVAEKTDTSNKASVKDGVITIADPGDNNGSATFTITVYPSTGDNDKTSKDVTIFWKTVKDGTVEDIEIPDQENEVVSVYCYYGGYPYKGQLPVYNDIIDIGENKNWTFDPSLMASSEENKKYVYKSTGLRTRSFVTSDGASWVDNYSNWSSPELIRAYNTDINQETYANFIVTTNNGSYGVHYDKVNNAPVIVAQNLEVKEQVNGEDVVLLKALGSTVNILEWTVNAGGLHKGNIGQNDSMYLSPSGWTTNEKIANSTAGLSWVIAAGANFGVTTDGHLYATNATISGEIKANTGNIGGWNISGGELFNNADIAAATAYISPTNGLKVGSNFSVNSGGNIVAINARLTSATIVGTVTAGHGKIGGWIISGNGLESDKTCLYSKNGPSVSSLISGTTSTNAFFIAGYEAGQKEVEKNFYIGAWTGKYGSVLWTELPEDFGDIINVTTNNKNLIYHDRMYVESDEKPAVEIFFEITGNVSNIHEIDVTIIYYSTSQADRIPTTYIGEDGSFSTQAGKFGIGCELGPTIKVGTWTSTNHTALYSGTANEITSTGDPAGTKSGFMLSTAPDANNSSNVSLITFRNWNGNSTLSGTQLLFNRSKTESVTQGGVQISAIALGDGSTGLQIGRMNDIYTTYNSTGISFQGNTTFNNLVTFEEDVTFKKGAYVGEYKPENIYTGSVNPKGDNQGSVGGSGLKWKTIYGYTGHFETIEANTFEITEFKPTSITTSTILPASANGGKLGEFGNTWGSCHILNGNFANVAIYGSVNANTLKPTPTNGTLLTIYGGAEFYHDLIPKQKTTGGAYPNLGSGANRWNTVYATNFDVTNFNPSSISPENLTVSAKAEIGELEIFNQIYPRQGEYISLGSSTSPWENLYTKQILVSGATSSSDIHLQVNGNANITNKLTCGSLTCTNFSFPTEVTITDLNVTGILSIPSSTNLTLSSLALSTGYGNAITITVNEDEDVTILPSFDATTKNGLYLGNSNHYLCGVFTRYLNGISVDSYKNEVTKNDLNTLSNSVRGLSNSFDELKKSVDFYDERISTNASGISTLSGTVSTLNTKVSSFNSKINQNTANITKIINYLTDRDPEFS